MGWVEPVSAAVSAVAALIAVAMARWAVLESQRLRKVQTSPEVVVYLERNDRMRTVVDLVISNIGLAPAYLVRIEAPNRPIPFGMVPAESVWILGHGIGFLAPGHAFRFSLNTFPELPKDDVVVDVAYYAEGEIDAGRPRQSSFTLRPREFEGFGEWQDRYREAAIAIKQGMDALRRGRVRVRVSPEGWAPGHPSPSPVRGAASYSPPLTVPEPVAPLDPAPAAHRSASWWRWPWSRRRRRRSTGPSEASEAGFGGLLPEWRDRRHRDAGPPQDARPAGDGRASVPEGRHALGLEGPEYRVLRRPIGSDIVELAAFGAADADRTAAWVRVDGWPALEVAMPAARDSATWTGAEEERFWEEVRRLARTHHLHGKSGPVDLVRHPPDSGVARRYEPEGEAIDR